MEFESMNKIHTENAFVSWRMQNENDANDTAHRVRRYLKNRNCNDVIGVCKKLDKKWYLQVLAETLRNHPDVADIATGS
jgi:hypothetical protein